MRKPNVIKLRSKRKKSILKSAAVGILSLLLVFGIAIGVEKGLTYYKMGQPQLLPGTCLVDGNQSGMLIMAVTGLNGDNYRVEGLIMFALPFKRDIPYRELNTQIKDGLIKEMPCSKE